MLNSIRGALRWFVDGLTEAVIAARDYLARRQIYRIDVADGNIVVDASNIPVGRLTGSDATLRFEPPDLAVRLAGAAINIELPPRWVWRRNLPPVGIDSVTYLDAFVCHHIERISPWRSTDVYYNIASRPIVNDLTRLAVEVGIVPKRAVDRILAVLTPLGGRLHLISRGSGDAEVLVIPIGAKQSAQHQRIRRLIVMALTIVGLAIAGWIAAVQWQISGLEQEVADIDRQITSRKAALAANRGGSAPGVAEALRTRRASQPYVVELVDALSRMLPDHAYLLDLRFEKDLIRISGISGRTSELVPVLERSGRFADVKFVAATTRLDDGRADRFHLEMRAAGAAPGTTP